MKRRLLCVCLSVLMLATLSGCSLLTDSGIYYIEADSDVDTLSDATIDKLVDNVVKSMTLDEKVGQLFIVDMSALEPSRKSVKKKQLSKTLKNNLALYPVGGVILYSADIKTPEQVKRLLQNLQAECDIPLFLCVDEEGGSVSRIASNAKMDWEGVVSMEELGQTGDTAQAERVGEELGKKLKELGFQVDFAPVSDVAGTSDVETLDVQSSQATELSGRMLGSTPKLVADMVKQLVKGITSEGVCATLKHFPGQGSASSDTHVSSAVVDKTIDELRASDFVPFASGIKAGAQFVMMSHESLRSVTGDNTPACMSSLIIQDILREELGFENIVVTDAMNMVPITAQYTSAEAAVNCIAAGVDMILMPQDLESAYDGVLDAVADGTLSEETIDTSVRRILKCKIEQKILPLDSEVVVKASQASYEDYQEIGDMENEE